MKQNQHLVAGRDLVIGRGPLGRALAKVLPDPTVYSKRDGSLSDFRSKLFYPRFDRIWIAAGFGSVEACAKDSVGAFETHVLLPLKIIEEYPNSKIICFSTDYVAQDDDPSKDANEIMANLSLYALSKFMMEKVIKVKQRGNTAVIRVGTIYDKESGLPYKLQQAFLKNGHLTCSSNKVAPTPAAWIAKALAENLDQLFSANHPTFHHVAPENSVKVVDFARHILPVKTKIMETGFDMKRPTFSNLGCSLFEPPTWEQLWEEYRGENSHDWAHWSGPYKM